MKLLFALLKDRNVRFYKIIFWGVAISGCAQEFAPGSVLRGPGNALELEGHFTELGIKTGWMNALFLHALSTAIPHAHAHPNQSLIF